VVFLALGTLSAYYYPGGNYISETAQGYSFWNNFLCDSIRNITCTGQYNLLGARLASLAMFALIFGGFFPMFFAFPYHLSKKRHLNSTIRPFHIISLKKDTSTRQSDGSVLLQLQYLLFSPSALYSKSLFLTTSSL
jgi:hypothetical protein